MQDYRSRALNVRLDTMNSVSAHLPAAAPFDFSPTLRFLKRNTPPGGSTAVIKNEVRHAASLGGQRILLHIAAAVDQVNQIACRAEAAGMDPAPLTDQIAAYVDNFLSLSDDLTVFYALATKDRKFAADVLPALHGYHQVKFPTPIESGVWAVLSQATPSTIARKLARAVAEAHGTVVAGAGDPLIAFPEASALAGVSKGELRDVIGNERKAVTILRLAEAFAAVDPLWLKTSETALLEAWLREIPGIGAWSATLILVRGLGRMDAVNVESGAALEKMVGAAQRVYGRRFDGKRFETMLERYGDSAGYWLHYLRAGP
jgi:DNA-3-methyladenine glycosylase II